MNKRNQIEEIKTEHTIIPPKVRTTTQGPDGTIAVGPWKNTKSDAQQASRERLNELTKKKEK